MFELVRNTASNTFTRLPPSQEDGYGDSLFEGAPDSKTPGRSKREVTKVRPVANTVKAAISVCHSCIAVIDDAGVYFNRLWCIVEMHYAHVGKKSIDLCKCSAV